MIKEIFKDVIQNNPEAIGLIKEINELEKEIDKLKKENEKLKKANENLKRMINFIKPFKKIWDKDNIWNKILKEK